MKGKGCSYWWRTLPTHQENRELAPTGRHTVVYPVGAHDILVSCSACFSLSPWHHMILMRRKMSKNRCHCAALSTQLQCDWGFTHHHLPLSSSNDYKFGSFKGAHFMCPQICRNLFVMGLTGYKTTLFYSKRNVCFWQIGFPSDHRKKKWPGLTWETSALKETKGTGSQSATCTISSAFRNLQLSSFSKEKKLHV